MSREPSKQMVEPLGFQCRKCHHPVLKVVYTRAGHNGQIIRRRKCAKCGTRVTTWERVVGW